MGTEQLRRLAYIALLVAVGVYLLEKVYALYQLFSHVVLLFSLAWLIAFIFTPLAERITTLRVPVPVGPRTVRRVPIPRMAAVILVYLMLLLAVTLAAVFFIPLVLEQVVQLEAVLAPYVSHFPQALADWQAYFAGLDISLVRTLLTESQIIGSLTQRLTDWGTELVENIPSILNGLVNLTIDLTIILVMSFYMTLDGPRIMPRLVEYLPHGWRSDAHAFSALIDRRFGGYVRSLLLQGLIYGVANAVIMGIMQLEFIAVSSVLAGVLICIPLVGSWLAVVAPLIIALFHGPERALITYIALLGFQQVLFHIIMPRLTGTIVGLHPLLVFLAILIGFPVGGVWGAVFAIPAVAVFVSVVEFIRARNSGTVPAS